MRFSEFREVREISELRNTKENGSGDFLPDPVAQKLGLIKTMSPDAATLKLKRRRRNERV